MTTRESYRASLTDKLVALEDGGYKACTSCSTSKPLDQFHRNPRTKDGRQYKCRTCCSEYGKRWYIENKDSVGKKCSAYYEKHKDRYRHQRREWRFRTQYNLTSAEWEVMFAHQGGRCASCGTDSAKRLVVDHCHDTGKVRGLVCDPCNLAIGLADDSPVRLRSIAAYLEGGDAQ